MHVIISVTDKKVLTSSLIEQAIFVWLTVG